MFWFQLTRPQTILLLFVSYTILTLMQELNGTEANEETSTDEKTIVNNRHVNELPHVFCTC